TQVERYSTKECNAASILLGLVDATINRLADLLEKAGRELDITTQLIFNDKPQEVLNHQKIFLRIGHSGNLAGKTRESLVTLGRMVAYIEQNDLVVNESNSARIHAQGKDIAGLSDYAGFLTSRVSFLLDAAIGKLGIEQNEVMKIFSIAAVMLMPPTLIAG